MGFLQVGDVALPRDSSQGKNTKNAGFAAVSYFLPLSDNQKGFVSWIVPQKETQNRTALSKGACVLT